MEDEKKWGHETLSTAPTSTYLAIFYDELHRQNISKRADRGDPDLDIEKALRRVDKETLALATSRFTDVLESAGISTKSKSPQAPASSAASAQIFNDPAAARRALEAGQSNLNRRQDTLADRGTWQAGQGAGGGANPAKGVGSGKSGGQGVTPTPPAPPAPPELSKRKIRTMQWKANKRQKR